MFAASWIGPSAADAVRAPAQTPSMIARWNLNIYLPVEGPASIYLWRIVHIPFMH